MTTTPAGYYPDGTGASRWWDGTAWSAEPEALDPVPEPRDRGRVAWLIALVLLITLIVVSIVLYLLAAKEPVVVPNCNLMAAQAVSLSRSAGTQPVLLQIANPTLVRNDTTSYAAPTDAQSALLYSCQGLGSYSDGSQSTTLIRMTLDTNGSYQVASATAIGATP